MQVLGTPVDLSPITVPTFVTGAITDHLTPWKGCYRTTELVGGPSTFVLSNAGHIASLVNPPGNPKATYYIDGDTGAGPEAWLKSATKRPERGGRSGRTGRWGVRVMRCRRLGRSGAGCIRRSNRRPGGTCATVFGDAAALRWCSGRRVTAGARGFRRSRSRRG